MSVLMRMYMAVCTGVCMRVYTNVCLSECVSLSLYIGAYLSVGHCMSEYRSVLLYLCG